MKVETAEKKFGLDLSFIPRNSIIISIMSYQCGKKKRIYPTRRRKEK